MDLARRIIDRDELKNPGRPPLSDLEKNQLAIKYIEMNMNPFKFKAYKRYLNNEGDVLVPGFDPFTGKEISERGHFQSMLSKTLSYNLNNMFKTSNNKSKT